MSVRVRYPPSPTGRKHIGNYRTFLFSWCFARSRGGQVVLRFEDTDAERSRREYEQGFIDTMRWLGLDWDEGPYRQSDRLAVYADAAARLEASGAAYRCWHTSAEVDTFRAASTAAGKAPHFEHDRVCRGLPPGSGRYAVRFAAPTEGETRFVDLVRGEVAVPNGTIGDRVLVRTDGTPVYQLAVTVDDTDMEITHVLRGEDLLPSTALQINIALALGRTAPPVYAHLPLIVGPDRSKLSTRHGPVALEDYKDDGFLAEALVNYMGLLGHSMPDGAEVFTLAELRDAFAIERVGATSAMFDIAKLESVNFEWIQRLWASDPAELVRRALAFFPPGTDPALLEAAMPIAVERVKRLSDLPPMLGFLFAFPGYDDASWHKAMAREDAPALLAASIEAVSAVSPFSAGPIGAAHAAAAEQLGVKLKVLQAPARVAITGSSVGPPLWDAMALLGRDECLARLRAAEARLRGGGAERP